MADHNLTGYAFKDGQLVHIHDVTRGLACGCVCVVCKAPLVARKGTERKPHFAHATDTLCEGAPESALHLLAKEVFEEMGSFRIPSYFFKKEEKLPNGRKLTHEQRIAKGGAVQIDEVAIEARQDGFIPDVAITSRGKTLFIEVAVTHRVDRKKMRRIRRRGLPVIEIRMHWSDALLSRDQLKQKIRHDTLSMHWLFHPGQREAEQIYCAMLREAKNLHRRLKVSLAQILPTPVAQKVFGSWNANQSLASYDRTLYAFYRNYQRYPTMEECVQLWPDLWRKPA